MGNTNSMCETIFGEALDIRKSSLNADYAIKRSRPKASDNEMVSPTNRISSIRTSTSAKPTRGSEEKISEKSHLMSVEDFNLIKVLGRGSYGKIYLTQKKTNKKFYALKTIKKYDLHKPSLRQSIFTERNVLLNSSHPFIVKLKYSFQTNSRIYMVMDFCQGGELFLHIRKQGELNEAAVRFYAAEVILAIQYLHEQLSTIHRDLKPENVLISADGHIKVTDFGLSKATKRTFSVCGTREYLAPEIILREGYGNLVDWWSLGCLIYEMLTGYPPFSSSDREQLSDDILLRRPEIPEGTSNELKDLINRLLTKESNYRLGLNGAEEIKAHPFFKDVDWEAVYNKKVTPPFVPALQSRDDVSNFHKNYVEEPVKETPIYRGNKLEDDDFLQFSFVDDQMSRLPSIADEHDDHKPKLDGVEEGKLAIVV